jgi:hypothetical protein
MRLQSISLVLRGFDATPEDVEALIGLAAKKIGHKGERRIPNREVTWPRSFVRYEIRFQNRTHVRDMVPALIEALGGVDHLKMVRDKINPEFVELDLLLPVKDSEEQEGGDFPPEVLQQVVKIGASIGFSFVSQLE